jgi:hypothetical protein
MVLSIYSFLHQHRSLSLYDDLSYLSFSRRPHHGGLQIAKDDLRGPEPAKAPRSETAQVVFLVKAAEADRALSSSALQIAACRGLHVQSYATTIEMLFPSSNN